MKVFRVIISIILTILFLINILAISALSIAKATVLSENYMVSKLDDFKAYDGAKEMIDDAIDEASDNYGQEIQILKEFSTKENVKKLVDIGVGFLYENEYFLPSGEKLNELLDDNIDELIKEENIELTSDEKCKKYNSNSLSRRLR